MTPIDSGTLFHLLDHVVMQYGGTVSRCLMRLFYVRYFIRGLGLEAMVTILTMKFIPIFLILWIISDSTHNLASSAPM